jgi:two-component system, OmpR family, alkaline phosphatase synthesis response regulator PhoP
MSDRDALRILVVDDDRDILDLLKYNFEKEGFKVKTLEKSHKAVAVAQNFHPHLIILDIMMPNINGMELCSQLRSIKDFEKTYIFFLTARSGSYYQQAALNTGGDDYIEKVIGLRALIYKVSSVLKKHFTIRKSIPHLRAGSLTLNRESQSVSLHDQEIKLNKAEFELLFFFAQNPGKIISVDALVNNIWGSEVYVFDSNIELYIDSLRKKISPDVIQSIQNRHYKFGSS